MCNIWENLNTISETIYKFWLDMSNKIYFCNGSFTDLNLLNEYTFCKINEMKNAVIEWRQQYKEKIFLYWEWAYFLNILLFSVLKIGHQREKYVSFFSLQMIMMMICRITCPYKNSFKISVYDTHMNKFVFVVFFRDSGIGDTLSFPS